MSEAELREIPLTAICASRWQPREAAFDAEALGELAASIAEIGLINPVVVFSLNGLLRSDGEQFELVAGERRVRAAIALAQVPEGGDRLRTVAKLVAEMPLAEIGHQLREYLDEQGATILARVKEADSDEALARLHRMAVVENIERQSLSPIEEARGLQGLMAEAGWTQRELARRIGKSQSYVAQRLALLALPTAAQEAVSTRVFTPSHARALASLPESLQEGMTAWAIPQVKKEVVSTRGLETLCEQMARFVDVARWQPAPGEIIAPEQRNWLRAIAWQLEQKPPSAAQLMRLSPANHYDNDKLKLKPLVIANDGWTRGQVVRTLWDVNDDEVWKSYAAECEAGCARCSLGGREWPAHSPCARAEKPEATTCPRFVGPSDPQIIEVHRWVANQVQDRQGGTDIEIGEEPFVHVTSVDDLALLMEAFHAIDRGQVERPRTSHVEEIAAWQRWQTTAGLDLVHFQAHSCIRCVNHRHEAAGEDGENCRSACRLMEEPFPLGCGSTAPRRLNWHVLVMRDGRRLPRCEGFSFGGTNGEHMLELIPEAFSAAWPLQPVRSAICEALRYAAERTPDYGSTGIGGVLHWLPWGWQPEGDSRTGERLIAWLLGKPEAAQRLPWLLLVALSEYRAVNDYSSSSGTRFALLNALTGEREEFAALHVRPQTVEGQVTIVVDENLPKGWLPKGTASPEDAA